MIKTATQLKALIRNLSKGDSAYSQILLRNFMMERFLERISLSRHKDKFILKGGMLISTIVGIDIRSTMDLDTTIKDANLNKTTINDLISEIISIPLDDGVSFRIKRIEDIMEGADYPGIRVNMDAYFDSVTSPVKIDISTGDAITPKEIKHNIKLMFENRSIELYAYNLETVVAEKLETIIVRSTANTRMRDFYDLYILSKLYFSKIVKNNLHKALKATASNRDTLKLIEANDINDLFDELEKNTEMKALWVNYQNNYYYSKDISWSSVCNSARELYKLAYPSY